MPKLKKGTIRYRAKRIQVNGVAMHIPKILHLCWFGNAVYESITRCVDTWRKHMPDFKIMEWSDKDIPSGDSPTARYLRTALHNRNYANVSNLMRFYVIDQFGGIYLDTDIEVVKSFEPLLVNQMFVGWQSNKQVNNAVMGAVPGHPLIKLGLDLLPNKFDGLEKANLSSPFFITELLNNNRGLKPAMFDKTAILKDVVVYPTTYFYPYWHTCKFDRATHVKEDTYCIHHWAATWK